MVARLGAERGTVLVTVILFVAIAIAALAAISSSRVVSESDHQRSLEQQAQALNGAYGQLQLAMNVVNTSAYTDDNRNIELRDAVAGLYGGTAGGEPDAAEEWLRDPAGVTHGKVRGTDVRVYRGRDYVQRLAQLNGATPTQVDPDGKSQSYYVLEALGNSNGVTRLVSALVRESEPFSSFVFFQNRHPLGVSGSPRGLIHANDAVAFYFPDGNYVDSVSSVNGFQYKAGANQGNTTIADGNPQAQPIDLQTIDFDDLKAKATFVGDPGLDAQIRMYADGHVRVRQYTPPRYEEVTYSQTVDIVVGYETQWVDQTQQVQIGTVQEEQTQQVISGYTTETYYVDVPIYETQTVEQTIQVPVYETQTVTCTRWVQVFVPYDIGTAVGGDGGVPGEYEWVEEQYPCEQQVLTGHTTETTTATVQVQVGTVQQEETRQVPVYTTETQYVDVPVYETQTVQVEQQVPVYESRVQTWTEQELQWPTMVNETNIVLADAAATLYIDGRITKLDGSLNGRMTIVGNEVVRITGNIRYVDAEGDLAMLNGDDWKEPYVRNDAYDGNSVLGLIARDDVLYTVSMPDESEINATLLSATGRVGIDGFQIDGQGEPVKDWKYGLSPADIERENAYIQSGFPHATFKYDSLRRIGGIISNDRILETHVLPNGNGTSTVGAGFKRGAMRFDFNLLFNPPPSFVEVPRPVAISIAPVYLMRNYDG